jgi:hypothetical protein
LDFLENIRNIDKIIILFQIYALKTSDSILLEDQILEYSILFFSSTRVLEVIVKLLKKIHLILPITSKNGV